MRLKPSKKANEVRVLSVDMAIDCGPQVNPERFCAQLEGGAIMGLSLALSGEITFGKGRVTQSNFHDYGVLRHNASPRTSRTPSAASRTGAMQCHLRCNRQPATGNRVRSLPVRAVG